MPPEPLPWDRRDFRKHDRSVSAVAGGLGRGGIHKWRDQNQHQQPPHRNHHAPPPYHHHHQQQQRWYSDFRSPGQSKQGGWSMYSGDPGQGVAPFSSRFDRNLENERSQTFSSRGNGRYYKNNRGSFTRKEWKGPSWEASVPHNSTGETVTEVNNLRSIEYTQPCHNSSSRRDRVSHAPLDSVSVSDQSQTESLVKEKVDNITDETTGKGQESEKENCLGPVELKPLKWSQVGSTCINHSTSSKSLGQDSIEVLTEVQLKSAIPSKSLTVDVSFDRSNSPSQSEDTGSRKKRRLGWGEGLAKYEKKKVDGPEDGTTISESSISAVSTESPQSQSANLVEKSARVERLLECASPATPSSVACSYSPDVLQEKSAKEANLDCDAMNVSCSHSIASPSHYAGSPINLQNLELESITNLSSLINELLQPNDPCSAENGDTQRMSMNKLLVWKVDVLKALEITESEIESLEMEMKSSISHTAGPRTSVGEQQSKPGELLDNASRYGVGHAVSKDVDMDSPGSATSKFVDVPAINLPEKEEFSEDSRNVDVDKPCNLDTKCLKDVSSSPESHGYVSSNVLTRNTSREDHDVGNIWGAILSSNRDAASRALEELNKLLPKQLRFDGSVDSFFSSMPRNSFAVKERFLKRKQFLQFKEKVLVLKFKVFQHFWKEGQVVSIKTLRGKTRKKFDPSRNGQKRHRSRVSSYAGGFQTVPANEVIDYVNNLLSQLAFKPNRNTLKMPALILDKNVKMSRFITNNGLVEDPFTVEKERSIINPWATEESEIFIKKLAAFGKDFRKIASFLDHKTVADCIEFYYKNHKSKWFEEARKNSGFIKQRKSQTTNYLVGSGKRRNREFNAASLDMLGAASEIVANIDKGMDVRQKCVSRSSFGGASSSCGPPRVVDHLLKGSDSKDMDNDNMETEAADVLAGICGSLSPETTSSSITSSVDLGDGYKDTSCPRISPSVKRPLTPEVTEDVDSECSDESCGEMNSTDWSDEEKSIFIRAVSSHGKDFRMVSHCVRTKSANQCKVFFSKARKSLGLDMVQLSSGAVSGDVDGGGSDIEDDCNMGTYLGTGNNSSEYETKETSPPPRMKSDHESEIVDTAPEFKTLEANRGQCPLDSTTNELVLENSVLVARGDDKPVTEVQYPLTTAVALNMESIRGAKEEVPDWPNEAEKGALVKVSSRNCAEEKQCHISLLPKVHLSDSTDVNDTSHETCWKKSELSHSSVDTHSSTQTCQKTNTPKEANVGMCSAEKSRVSSLPQNGRIAPVASTAIFSVPIKYSDTPNHNALLPVEANGNDGTRLSSYSLGSPQILQGYPLSLQAMKGTNRDVSSAARHGEHSNSDWHTDFSLQKCKEARQNDVSFSPLERVRDRSTPPQSSCSSAGDNNPPRKGDVKLFGKILSSSLQKPVERADENSSSQNQRLKLISEQKDSAQSKFDCNGYAPPEKMPARKFTLWDGNRLQTTPVPPMLDSARLLAKYPSAFSNFVPSTLLGPVDGTSVFQRREMSSSIGVKQVQDDTLAEMQRRNTLNAAAGTSGVGIAGQGTMVLGREYPSLTDPVAAIKMHYARMQGGNIVFDTDGRWINSRDVGR